MASLDAILKVVAKGEGFASVSAGIRSIGQAGKEASAAVGGIGSVLGGLTGGLVSLGAGLSAAGVAMFAKSVIDAADDMRDLSQRTGVSVEMLSKFGQAANMAGSDLESVGGAMVKLSRGLAKAAATGKGPAADALRTLGISAVDASGQLRTADQVMLQVADRFRQLPDGAQKATLAIQLFGKSGAEMIPMLNEGRQAIEGLNATMSTKMANRADAYNDSLAAFGAVFTEIGAIVVSDLLPALTDAVDWLTKVGIGIRDNVVAYREPIKQVVDVLGKAIQFIAPLIYSLNVAGSVGLAIQRALGMVITDSGTAEVNARKLAAGMSDAARSAAQLKAEQEAARQKAAELKAQQEAFTAAVEQSNAQYNLLKATIDATGQAIQSQSGLRQETFNADIAVNNAAKSILEAKLSQAKTDADKIPILRQIMAIELENARIQREAASEQIRQEVIITDLKRQKAWQELRSAQNALATAQAYGQQTEQLQAQVNLLKVAANSADLEFKMQQKIAQQKERANQATFKAQQVQITNNRQAPALTQSGPGPAPQGRPLGYVNGVPYYSQSVMPYGGLPQMASGAFVTGATRAVVGEAGPEYVIPASRMAAASQAYLQGARGVDVVNGKSASGGGLSIIIQTGPVMQQDGQVWVTFQDFEAGLNATAAAVLNQLCSPATRLALGG